jgi:hypothetical protein
MPIYLGTKRHDIAALIITLYKVRMRWLTHACPHFVLTTNHRKFCNFLSHLLYFACTYVKCNVLAWDALLWGKESIGPKAEGARSDVAVFFFTWVHGRDLCMTALPHDEVAKSDRFHLRSTRRTYACCHACVP